MTTTNLQTAKALGLKSEILLKVYDDVKNGVKVKTSTVDGKSTFSKGSKIYTQSSAAAELSVEQASSLLLSFQSEIVKGINDRFEKACADEKNHRRNEQGEVITVSKTTENGEVVKIPMIDANKAVAHTKTNVKSNLEHGRFLDSGDFIVNTVDGVTYLYPSGTYTAKRGRTSGSAVQNFFTDVVSSAMFSEEPLETYIVSLEESYAANLPENVRALRTTLQTAKGEEYANAVAELKALADEVA